MDIRPTKGNSACHEDSFEAVLLLEERLNDQGYQSGFTAGCSQGLVDGFAAGQKEGAAVCSEVTFYLSFTESWITFLNGKTNTDEKIMRVLRSFHQMLMEFQILDVGFQRYTMKLSAIKAKFKQLGGVPWSYKRSKGSGVIHSVGGGCSDLLLTLPFRPSMDPHNSSSRRVYPPSATSADTESENPAPVEIPELQEPCTGSHPQPA